MSAPKQACTEQGRAHTWEARNKGWQRRLYKCASCGGWGWAPPEAPSRITPFKEVFKDRTREAEPRPEPTVLTERERRRDEHPSMARAIVLRGYRPREKRAKAWYTPRYRLDDWIKRG